VLDRLIQQAVLQVFEPVFEPHFSDHSYGFRLGRSAHQAVCGHASSCRMTRRGLRMSIASSMTR
jgi:hypothetical protein